MSKFTHVILWLALASDPLRIVAFQPMSGGWAGGVYMSQAVRQLAARINAHGALLPDYQLEILEINTLCEPRVAEQAMLDILLHGDMQQLRFNGTEFASDAAQVGGVRESRYAAFLGGGCSGATMAFSNIAARARKPLVSTAATSPTLSDRVAFPFFWRAAQPDTQALMAMAQIVAEFGAREVALWTSPLTQSWAQAALGGLAAVGIAPVGGAPFPVEAMLTGRGFYLDDATPAELAQVFVRQPSRFNLLILYGDAQAQVLCALRAAGVQGIIPLAIEWSLPGPADACWDEVRVALTGALGLGAVNQRTDRGTEHGCLPGVDPVDFNADMVAGALGPTHGDMAYMGPASDALCMVVRALHAMLYTRQASFEDLHDMSAATFQAMQEELAATDFEGVTGPVRFRDQGDPRGLVGPDPDGLTRVVQLGEAGPPGQVGLVGPLGVAWSVPGLRFQGFGALEEDFVPGGTAAAPFATCLGLALDFASNTCVPCPPGTAFRAGCEPCLPGFFEAGGSCTACPGGSFAAAAGATSCGPCPPGAYALPGATECTPCAPGTWAPAGSMECARCKAGSFAPQGQPCAACPGTNGFTTLTTGATSRAACTCGPGMFWNARDDKCVLCRADAYCPGGLHLPVVYEGKYALYLGSVDNHADAQASKQAGTWSSSSDRAGAFYELEVYNCGASTHCPGESATFGFAEYGSELGSTTQTGIRAAGCPDLRLGIACARCEDGYYGVGDCEACSAASSALNGIVLIVLPFVMMCLYRATTSGGTARVQSAFILVSTCGMAAFFMQTIAVLDNMSVAWPEEISWLFNISRVFMFDLGGLSLSCLHGNSFAAKYWASILIPIVILVMTGVGFVISQAPGIPDTWKMMPNHTVSMIGMFLSALYITLVKVVLAYFECPENPAAPATLAKYKDIICDSDDHAAAMFPMALGLMLYVLGFYLAFCWAAWVAPTSWNNVAFRERWKFMMTRWRPDVWFWGTVVMTRNLLVALAGVIATETRSQLCYVCLVVTVVFAVTAVYQPWRATPLNHYDVLSSIILCFIGILGLVFVSLEEEITMYQRIEMYHVAEAKMDMRGTFGTATTIMVGVFVALFVLLMGWTLLMLVPAQAEKEAHAHAKTCSELFQQFKSIAQMQDFDQRAERRVRESTSYDRAGLKNFLRKMVADERTKESGATDTISIKQAKNSQVKTSQTSVPQPSAADVSA